MAIEKVLIVDDEMLVRTFLAETLRRKNLDVLIAESGEKAYALLKENTFDLVITDMKMPNMSGIDLLKKVKELSPQTIVVVITAYGSIENAVEAMRLGAFTYLIKPFPPDTIEAIIDKAREHQSLVEENSYLRQQVAGGDGSSSLSKLQIVGKSLKMKKILYEVERAAKSNANIFISGESGTGKEVIAHAIHYGSGRATRPFIKVNCAAMPETLIESELLGHEKGAFTGANARRCGRFELANGGTLLLDEVTEIPLGVQAKLLRVVQEQEFERVGGSKTIKVDVRLISTSNRDIREAISQKILREDLYYRLNVIPILLPPLRERRDDIIPLAEFFLEKMARENHKEKKKLSKEAEDKLLAYGWPGNIRELANIIERTVVMDQGEQIAADQLVLELQKPRDEAVVIAASAAARISPGMTLEQLERKFIIETLHAQHNNYTSAAELLGITVRTLRSKLRGYELQN